MYQYFAVDQKLSNKCRSLNVSRKENLEIYNKLFSHSVARKMKMKEKQKKRKAYEPKLTHEELMDSSTFKRFSASIDNILENLEDVDFTTMGDYLLVYIL